MPLETAGNRQPITVMKYLLPEEVDFTLVRKHKAILLRPVAFLVLGVIIAGVLTGFIGVHHRWVLVATGVFLLVVLGYFIYQAIQYWVSYFVLTKHRCLQTSGLITRRATKKSSPTAARPIVPPTLGCCFSAWIRPFRSSVRAAGSSSASHVSSSR